MERTLERTERAYKNMEAVAKMLEATSENGARYEVEDVYLDIGQNWMWTTICRKDYRECQVLYPRQWKDICMATTLEELAQAAEAVKADKYFND